MATKDYQVEKTEKEDVIDDWSEDSIEYFYSNKVFFPGFVRSFEISFTCIRYKKGSKYKTESIVSATSLNSLKV